MIKIDNFIKLFERAVRESWDRPALTDFRKSTISYRELAERIETLDIIGKKAGLKRGDKIAINTRPCALGASLYYACCCKGYVAVELYNASIETPQAKTNDLSLSVGLTSGGIGMTLRF